MDLRSFSFPFYRVAPINLKEKKGEKKVSDSNRLCVRLGGGENRVSIKHQGESVKNISVETIMTNHSVFFMFIKVGFRCHAT